MKKLTATIAALLVAACSTPVDPADQYRDALPKAQAVELGTPQAEGAPAGALSVARQPLGQSDLLQSEYAVMSYYLAVSVNGGAGIILGLVRFIASLPPSSCDDGRCTWGPWAGDQGLNAYRLVAAKDGDAYHYALQGKPWASPDEAFVDILVGTANPVDRDHGSGTFTLDFDAADAGLAHGPGYERQDFGLLVVDYDNTRNVTVGAEFIGARNQDPDPAKRHFMNAAYLFVDEASGGRLQVAFENLGTGETVSLNTRWGGNGQGRCDVVYTPAAGPSGTATECWAGRSADFAEVYDSLHMDIPELSDPGACAPFTEFEPATLPLPVVPR